MANVDMSSMLAELKARCASVGAEGPYCDLADRPRCWLAHDHHTVVPVSSDQILSLHAMIAYVAHTTGQNEFRVERDFVNRFCVPNVTCLPVGAFDQALRFLAEQIPSH